MDQDLVKLYDEAPIARIQLNDTARKNVLSGTLVDQLNNALDWAQENPAIRAIILHGDTGVFCAGANIKELAEMTSRDARVANFPHKWHHISTIDKPIVAAVSGFCLGGGFEVALMCDMIVAAFNAQFALPEIKLGLMPGGGGLVRLVKLLGAQTASYYAMTGEPMDALRAQALGVVQDVVDLEHLLPRARDVAHMLTQRSRTGLRAIKATVGHVDDLPMDQALAHERVVFQELLDTPDGIEGRQAFITKRAPSFS